MSIERGSCGGSDCDLKAEPGAGLTSRQRAWGVAIWFLCCACATLFACGFSDGTHDASGPSQLTAEERAWLDAHDGTIRLGPDPSAPPLDFFDDEGRYRGLTADYVRLIERKLNFRFDVVRAPSWRTLLEMAQRREVDMICAAERTPDRSRYLLFTTPFIRIPNVIVTREVHEDQPLTLEALRGKRVTMVESYAVAELLQREHPWLQVVPAANDLDGLLKVSFGKADAMIIDLTMASHLIAKNHIPNLRVSGDSGKVISLGFASRSDWPILQRIMEKGVAMVTPAERKEIFDRWISLQAHPPYYTTTAFWLRFGAAVLALLAALALVALWTTLLRREVARKTVALQKSEERFRGLFEDAPISIWELDLEPLARYLQALDSPSDGDFLRHLTSHPDLVSEGLRHIRVIAANARTLSLLQVKDLDELRKSLPSIFPEPSYPDLSRLMSALRSGERQCEFEARLITGAGQPLDTVLHWSTAARRGASNGAPTLLCVVDVSAIKRMEAELRQSRHVEALGTLAGGVAHDFNNILLAIIAYAELGQMRVGSTTTEHEYFGGIVKAGMRATDLVSQILTFSRQSQRKREPVVMRQVVEEALELVRTLLPSAVSLHCALPQPEGSLVFADPTQLHQVVMNLCKNAIDAMKERPGELRVELVQLSVEQPRPTLACELKPGRYQLLTVSDSGPGIAAHDLARIFDPYFTTRRGGTGTGLGLSVVHGIVQSHGGGIEVDSVVGAGTTFRVYVPCMDGAVSSAKLVAASGVVSDRLPRGEERVFLVDDEAALVTTVAQMLTELGYHVHATTSSLEALSSLTNGEEGFDLLVTDKNMPELGGVELIEELTRRGRPITALLCTGFNHDLTPQRAAALGVAAIVSKPFTLAQLAHAVRTALDSRTPLSGYRPDRGHPGETRVADEVP